MAWRQNLEKYVNIQQFAKEQGVAFYSASWGIVHQILVEEGYAFPYALTVASDSHSNMYGGVGCLGTPVVRTDTAAIWVTRRTWWQIPLVATVEFQGRLRPGVTGKDVIITLCGMFNWDEVLNHAIEFTGAESIQSLGMDERLALWTWQLNRVYWADYFLLTMFCYHGIDNEHSFMGLIIDKFLPHE